eukprot:UN17853
MSMQLSLFLLLVQLLQPYLLNHHRILITKHNNHNTQLLIQVQCGQQYPTQIINLQTNIPQIFFFLIYHNLSSHSNQPKNQTQNLLLFNNSIPYMYPPSTYPTTTTFNNR